MNFVVCIRYVHPIRSMELVEKAKLLRRLSFNALAKIHLDRYGSFRKILIILYWDISLNLGPGDGIQNKNLLFVLPFHECSFCRDGFYYNLNSLCENVRRNDWDIFKKRVMHFIHRNINKFLPKIDEIDAILRI